MTKLTKSISKLFFGIIILFITSIFVSCMTTLNLTEVDYKTFNDDVTKINIESVTGDVVVKNSDDEKLHVRILANETGHHRVDSTNGTLTVETGIELKSVESYKSKIIISIPKNSTGKDLKIKATTGDVEVKEIKNIDVVTTTGNVTIDTVSNKFNINVTTGDISVGKAELNEKSEIHCITGGVTVKNTNAKVNARTTTGKKSVTNGTSNVMLEISVVTGNINVN